VSPETHYPGTHEPDFGGMVAATRQADTRTSAYYMDQREDFGSISTKPCVCSRQADYGHALISPINRSTVPLQQQEYALGYGAPGSPYAQPLTPNTESGSQSLPAVFHSPWSPPPGPTSSTPLTTSPVWPPSPLTTHNYDNRTSAIVDQRENLGSISTTPSYAADMRIMGMC